MEFIRVSLTRLEIALSVKERDRLIVAVHRTETKAKHKSGGWQNLQRHWVQHLVGDRVVLTDPVWIERTERYNTRYGDGGFQGRTGGIDRFGPGGIRDGVGHSHGPKCPRCRRRKSP